MIDNTNTLKKILTFENPLDFYVISIKQRRKDFPKKLIPKKSCIILGQTIIRDHDDVDDIFSNVKEFCEKNQTRAYLYVNKHNYEFIAYETLSYLVDRIKSKSFSGLENLFDKVSGKKTKSKNRWVIDIDGNVNDLNKTKTIIQEISPNKNVILCEVPTRNGYHIITTKFNSKLLKENNTVSLHKNNPTLLYFPDSLEFRS